MITRNGKTAAGWRLDELRADGAAGLEFLLNPFAIVPKEENADRIVKAFEAIDLMREWYVAREDFKKAMLRAGKGETTANEADEYQRKMEQADKVLIEVMKAL